MTAICQSASPRHPLAKVGVTADALKISPSLPLKKKKQHSPGVLNLIPARQGRYPPVCLSFSRKNENGKRREKKREEDSARRPGWPSAKWESATGRARLRTRLPVHQLVLLRLLTSSYRSETRAAKEKKKKKIFSFSFKFLSKHSFGLVFCSLSSPSTCPLGASVSSLHQHQS